MYVAEKQITVRYGETDQMGVVYYGNYSLYYEEGRTDAIKKLGISYKELEETGIVMPVAELNIKYIRPARYDETITVKTIIKELPSRKMRFHTEIYNADDDLINLGLTTLVFIDKAYNRVTQPPQQLLDVLQPYFANKPVS